MYMPLRPRHVGALMEVHKRCKPGLWKKGRRAGWAKVGHLAHYYYDMLLARLGIGEGERANTSAGSRA